MTLPPDVHHPVSLQRAAPRSIATTAHWGSYARLGAAHRAVIEWCRVHGHRLAGSRWEVYGHWTEDEAKLRTDVYYLLAPDTARNVAGDSRAPA
jgi:effector-binding domain-containing protein